jgi:hypothetical protein
MTRHEQAARSAGFTIRTFGSVQKIARNDADGKYVVSERGWRYACEDAGIPVPLTLRDMGTMERAYLECLLWASSDQSNDQGGTPLDQLYNLSDLSSDVLAHAVESCATFRQCAEGIGLLDLVDADPSRAGHDLWLSRNGHGAGFFDGDWGEHGDALQELARGMKEIDAYVGDDGDLYVCRG